MFSMEITNIPGFMNHLLSKDTFDHFLTVEASIRMAVTYQIDGSWNKDFFDSEEVPSSPYASWKEVRAIVYQIVKGRRLPSSMKIVLSLPEAYLNYLFGTPGEGDFRDSISGVHLNILYSPKSLKVTSGIAGHSFLMDRRPEQLADEALKSFLKKKEIC